MSNAQYKMVHIHPTQQFMPTLCSLITQIFKGLVIVSWAITYYMNQIQHRQ